MFSLDRWQEILDTLRRHKLRTTLTAVSVSWGIFMLVLLLGFGKGLRNNADYQFRDDAINSIWLHRGRTSIPYKGIKPGRSIRFDNDDYEAIKRISGVEHITGRFYLWGDLMVTYGSKSAAFDVRAVHPGHRYLEKTVIVEGRYVNDADLEEGRKVAVIGTEVRSFLFGESSAVGRVIEIGNISYTVIGTFEDVGRDEEVRKIFIPVSTAQLTYSGQRQLHAIMFTLGDADLEESNRVAAAVREYLAQRHDFHPDDPRAVRLRNNLESYQRFAQIFDLLRLFVWFVGLGTLVAGIVGVSNIMLISVAERTREFGVRKAVGATPWSIVSAVMQESIFLTALAGYLGVVAGVGTLEVFKKVMGDNEFLRRPEVDIGVVLIAAGLVVFFGALAGFFPAFRAARINPVKALRSE